MTEDDSYSCCLDKRLATSPVFLHILIHPFDVVSYTKFDVAPENALLTVLAKSSTPFDRLSVHPTKVEMLYTST